jgi:hypothetical protein
VPINRFNQKFMMRGLYAGQLEDVTLLKRGDDQQQGAVRSAKLFGCRWSKIYKTGQTIQGDMVGDHRRQLHIPAAELERVGVAYLNPTDRFVDQSGRYWQPESTTTITIKLLETHFCVQCLRVDPPVVSGVS